MFKTALLQSRRSMPSLSRTARLNLHASPTMNTSTTAAEDAQKRFRSDADVRYKFVVSEVMGQRIEDYVKRVGAQPTGAAEKCQEVYYDYSTERDQTEDVLPKKREEQTPAEVSSSSAPSHGRLNTEDRSPYALTKQDIWLQRHGGEWVCKTPFRDDMTQKTHLAKPLEDRVPNFRTLRGERDIRIELNLQQDMLDKEHLKTMEESLRERNIVPFATIHTETTKYQLPDEFVLEVIKTDFGYQSGVLSIYVPQAKERDMQVVGERMQKVTEEIGIEHVDYCPTPAMEYIYRNKKDHYRVLVRAGIAPEKKE